MSDPYAEATRHERKRMPTFAKAILVVGGLVAVAFVTIATIATLLVKRQFEDMAMELENGPAFALASDATIAEAVSDAARSIFGEDVRINESDLAFFDPSAAGQEIHIDMSGLEEGLAGLESGLEALVAESLEKGIRIEGSFREGADSWLQIDCRDCPGRLELHADEEGGSLRIRGPGGSTRVDLGNEAARLPRWVPTYPGARLQKRLFSGERDGYRFGGVLHTSGAQAEEVYDWFEENLRSDLDGISNWNGVWKNHDNRGLIQVQSRSRSGTRELTVITWANDEGQSSIVTMHKMER